MAGDLEFLEVPGKKLSDAVKRMQKLRKRELLKEIRSSLAKGSKPARMRVRNHEREVLPSGMRKYATVPSQTITVTGRGVGMRWKQKRGLSDLQSIDRGRLRHPLYGNRNFWYDQSIEPGMWSKAVEEEGPKVVAEATEQLIRYAETVMK